MAVGLVLARHGSRRYEANDAARVNRSRYGDGRHSNALTRHGGELMAGVGWQSVFSVGVLRRGLFVVMLYLLPKL